MNESHSNGAPKPERPRIVFEFDPTTGGCAWRLEGPFPLPFLVNILEVAALAYKSQQLQQLQQAAQKGPPGLFLGDGSPAPRW